MLRVGLCRMGLVDLWFVLWLRVLVGAGLIDFIWLCMLGCVCLGLIILGFRFRFWIWWCCSCKFMVCWRFVGGLVVSGYG